MRIGGPPIAIVVVFAAVAAIVPQATAQDSTARYKSFKEEVLTLTVPPACKLTSKIVEGKGLTEASIRMLRGMGHGVKGVPEGTGLPVKCDDVDGSGWIDAAGELQAFIVPSKGWWLEKSGTATKPVSGKLHIITKALLFRAEHVEGNYVVYSGASLGPFARRLLLDIGIGIKGNPSSLLVNVAGERRKGAISASGNVTLTDEAWPD